MAFPLRHERLLARLDSGVTGTNRPSLKNLKASDTLIKQGNLDAKRFKEEVEKASVSLCRRRQPWCCAEVTAVIHHLQMGGRLDNLHRVVTSKKRGCVIAPCECCAKWWNFWHQ